MKCSRCGEECKEYQVFCLKCGTPIQVVPDFNLIEAELADNIGQFMTEDNDEKRDNGDLDYLDDESYVDTMPEHTIEPFPELSVVNIDKVSDDSDFDVDGSQFNKRTRKRTKNSKETKEAEVQAEKNALKIKAVIFGFVVVIVVGIAILFLTMFSKKSSSDNFSKKYNEGYDYYTSKSYSDAIACFKEAKANAKNNKQKIKVNKSLLAAYENMGDSENQQIEILRDLIKLLPKEKEYYRKLIAIYDSRDMNDEITDLMDSIEDVSLKSDLSEYTVPAVKFSEESGSYDTFLTIKLTSQNNTIYYTLDGSTPNEESSVYAEPIKIKKSGTTIITAYAVNAKGLKSKLTSATYNINSSSIDAPEVVPESGTYTKQKDIEINVPIGYKCYYTYGETATIPTASDKEYTEPVKMIRGKNYFSAVFISDTGNQSEVTQRVYQLNLSSTLTYDNALVMVKNYLTQKNLALVNEAGEYVTSEGHNINFKYNSIAEIEEGEYYVIDVNYQDASGALLNVVRYGVETISSNLVELEKDPDNAGQFKIKQDEVKKEEEGN